jgi:hypothetical protein
MGNTFSQRDNHIKNSDDRAKFYKEQYEKLMEDHKRLLATCKQLADENKKLKETK